MTSINDVLTAISGVIWGPFLLIPLLMATGVYLTVRLGGVQFKLLGHALWLAFIKRRDGTGKEAGDVSHFGALMTAMAATIGIGNITGVATAISMGGPGAIFWMWLMGLLGMATKYAEAFLGNHFRHQDQNGEYSGSAAYYLRDGVGGKLGGLLSIAFCLFAVVASFGIGNMTQAHTVSHTLEEQFRIPLWFSGAVMALIVMVVIIGGIKTIASFASLVVPIMVLLYMLSNIVVLGYHWQGLGDAFHTIVADAFSGSAAAGGFTGATVMMAIQYGVARGIFSNESGLGSGAFAAAAAQSSHPVRQAMVSMTQTFIDTIIMVSLTALMIVVTGAYKVEGLEGASITGFALESVFGPAAGGILAVAALFFALTTILGWSYYGERSLQQLSNSTRLSLAYRVVFSFIVFIGSITQLEAVWTFSDIANGLMALPNLVGLLVLTGLVARETNAYLSQPDWKKG
ncbi:alanine/glycine:cation symporter family protein [Carnimonas bestiolae]|uniref:alanine/glycine:cation symporter family protein n=1 Tax=Carnimonas bestiolae TaxID=3402172 RepID=UPI003EDBCE92